MSIASYFIQLLQQCLWGCGKKHFQIQPLDTVIPILSTLIREGTVFELKPWATKGVGKR